MDSRHKSVNVVVITDMNYSQYAQVMASNLAELEMFTETSQLQVYVEIRKILISFLPSRYFFEDDEIEA